MPGTVLSILHALVNFSIKANYERLSVVAHLYNPSYSVGGDQEDRGSTPA
jgi:hypothetical protein